MTDFKKQGKKNRASGKRFELKVRADLEKKGWLVMRNNNDVELVKDVLVWKQAKTKWNPFTRSPMMISSGFPDFIILKKRNCGLCIARGDVSACMDVSFIECKAGKYLSKEEKIKAQWIKEYIGPVSVAHKGEKRGKIEYYYA